MQAFGDFKMKMARFPYSKNEGLNLHHTGFLPKKMSHIFAKPK
jgi:hypothetical protein